MCINSKHTYNIEALFGGFQMSLDVLSLALRCIAGFIIFCISLYIAAKSLKLFYYGKGSKKQGLMVIIGAVLLFTWTEFVKIDNYRNIWITVLFIFMSIMMFYLNSSFNKMCKS
jgi:hypothetical protein